MVVQRVVVGLNEALLSRHAFLIMIATSSGRRKQDGRGLRRHGAVGREERRQPGRRRLLESPGTLFQPGKRERFRQYIDNDSIASRILWHKGPNTRREPSRR